MRQILKSVLGICFSALLAASLISALDSPMVQGAYCALFTSSLGGCAPASGGGTTNFLRADGTWNAPSGTGLSTTLTSAHLYVGNGSNVATDVAITGDTTISNAGVTSTTKVNGDANVAFLDVASQTLAGGANVTSLTQSTGNITVNCGSRPLQYITNGGAFTITAPSSDGSCILKTTNNGSAGTITFSGFSVGANTGDTLDTTNAHKFAIFIFRINGDSGYRIAAYQ